MCINYVKLRHDVQKNAICMQFRMASIRAKLGGVLRYPHSFCFIFYFVFPRGSMERSDQVWLLESINLLKSEQISHTLVLLCLKYT